MNISQRKLGFTANAISQKNIPQAHTTDLFMPQQLQSIKLNNLRNKRRQLQEKLKLVSNRISFRRKKQEDQLRRYIRTQQKSRVLSETQQFKKINMMIKQQLNQKKAFQEKKKSKQVEDSRTTMNRRLHMIYQSIRDRKLSESGKLRQTNKMQEQFAQALKHQAEKQIKQKHENILRMKQRQLTKRKCYWLQKRLTFHQNIIQESSIYENQIQNYYKKIEQLRKNQQILKQKEQQAIQILKCAQQNYELLKQS